jgi:hypothetical protein
MREGSGGESRGDVGGKGRAHQPREGPNPIKIQDFLEFSLEGGRHFPRRA